MEEIKGCEVMTTYRETALEAPPLRMRSSGDSLPDGAAYWDTVHRREHLTSEPCVCTVPIVGRPGTPNRWTCRTCAGKVQRPLHKTWKHSPRFARRGTSTRVDLLDDANREMFGDEVGDAIELGILPDNIGAK